MRVLITGSEGTLGPKLRAELEGRGHFVFGSDLFHSSTEYFERGDMSNYRQAHRIFQITTPDVVYHLGAEFGRMNGEMFYEQLWQNNAIATRNVIDLCLLYNAHLVFASSSEAYGTLSDENAMHEDLLKTHVPSFHNEYALSKWTNEKQIEIAVNNRGLSATILRFFNAYGPGEHYSPYRSVVCLFIYSLMKGLPITLYKNYHRVFMYVDDWARTVANVTDVYKTLPSGEVFNIGGEEYKSVEELKDMIVDLLGGTSSHIHVLEKEVANVTNKRPNIEKAKSILEHDPKITLAEGLPKTIEWMKKIYG